MFEIKICSDLLGYFFRKHPTSVRSVRGKQHDFRNTAHFFSSNCSGNNSYYWWNYWLCHHKKKIVYYEAILRKRFFGATKSFAPCHYVASELTEQGKWTREYVFTDERLKVERLTRIVLRRNKKAEPQADASSGLPPKEVVFASTFWPWGRIQSRFWSQTWCVCVGGGTCLSGLCVWQGPMCNDSHRMDSEHFSAAVGSRVCLETCVFWWKNVLWQEPSDGAIVGGRRMTGRGISSNKEVLRRGSNQADAPTWSIPKSRSQRKKNSEERKIGCFLSCLLPRS